MEAKHSSVVILGAGPAGLATGCALARAGWSVQVFEQAPVVGGLARTLSRDGFLFDIGGHRWFTKKDELNAFFIDILRDEIVLVDRISRIYFDGKYVDYPLKMSNALSKIGPSTSVRALGDFVASKASQLMTPKPVVSMEDAYVAQFGRTLYEKFFRNYSEKVWGQTCDQLSGDWVTQRSKGLSLFTTLMDAIKPSKGQVESLVDRFMYPSLGFGRLSERMAAEIRRNGGQVHCGWRAVRVGHDAGRIEEVVLQDAAGEERVVGSDAFVSSIPMTELAQILSPAADRATIDAARALSYRDLITVNVMLDRQQVTNDTWVYIHDPSISFARLHEPRNWSAGMAPAGKTSLVLELFCNVDDPLWQRSDDDVCQLAVDDLVDRLHFVERNEVLGAFALRSRDTYPRYGLEYKAAVDGIKAHLRSFPNLNIVGRGGTFRYNNTDHSIETGLLAARHILGERVDVDSVNSASEYLEERRVASDAKA
jgi:protoporphyrinogen oxidase